MLNDNIIGTSLKNLKEAVKKFASAGNNILFFGDRGTGKEEFAKLYYQVTRKDKFFPINCSGTSDELIESKLFGHVKGAYTGAIVNREGLIDLYGKRGVIFLDEIGDASDHFQAILLRVLQTGEYERLGADGIKKVNPEELTVIAATSKLDCVRDDLRDRFHVFCLPKLRERKNDIIELVKKFCGEFGIEYISEEAFKIICDAHPWPGNVRELKNVLVAGFHYLSLRKDDTLRHDDIPSISNRWKLIEDKSEKIKIADLKSDSSPLPRQSFLLDQERLPRPSILGSDKMREIHMQLLESTKKSIEKITEAITGPGALLENRIKDTTESRLYDRVTPKEWEEKFWEHHVRNNRSGMDVEKLFGGRINNKTAYPHLREAKIRMGLGKKPKE